MRKFYVFVLLFAAPFFLKAQDVITASGNWNDPSIWSASAPAASVTTDVSMNNTFSVTVVGGDNFMAGNMTTGSNNTLTIQGGELQLGDPTHTRNLDAGSNMTITVQNTGTLIIWGDLNVSTSLIISIQPGGQIIIKGSVTLATNASINVNGDLEIDGDLTGGNATNVNAGPGSDIQVGGTLTVGVNSHYNASCDGGLPPPGTNCSTFHVHACAPDVNSQAFCAMGGLPIELLYFKAQPNLSSVALSWSTASELNFDYFSVEKSSDGIHFEEFAKVSGSGTSRVQLNYSLIDEKPLAGRSYYRMTEIDLDQTFHHLKVIGINFSAERLLSIYPNPVTGGIVNFQLNFVPDSNVTVSVVDLRGAVVSQFIIDKQTLALPVVLPAGMYVVNVRSAGFNAVSKMMVR